MVAKLKMLDKQTKIVYSGDSTRDRQCNRVSITSEREDDQLGVGKCAD
jgi:hypothetical protein